MSLKKDFPIFSHNPGLVYLDSAATLQKPAYVIDGVKEYLEHDYANIHRGRYSLSEKSEQLFWQARKKVADFLHASDEAEVVFTGHSTDSSNKLVQSLGVSGRLQAGDVVVLSELEHHANIVPRQMAKEQWGIEIQFIPSTPEGDIDWSQAKQLFTSSVKVVALTLASNVTGDIVDYKQVRSLLEECYSTTSRPLVVYDASQAVPHTQVDVQQLGCDFLYFTGHKLGAFTGIGVLRGKKQHLDVLQPSHGGGGAIEWVTKAGYGLLGAPDKFEPGTPNLVGAISLLKGLEYLELVGERRSQHEQNTLFSNFYATLHTLETEMMQYCLAQFTALRRHGVVLLGSSDLEKKIGVFSFLLPSGFFPTQLGQYMAEQDICIRCGGQCAQIFHDQLGQQGSCRISLWGYNELADVQRFFVALREFLRLA